MCSSVGHRIDSIIFPYGHSTWTAFWNWGLKIHEIFVKSRKNHRHYNCGVILFFGLPTRAKLVKITGRFITHWVFNFLLSWVSSLTKIFGFQDFCEFRHLYLILTKALGGRADCDWHWLDLFLIPKRCCLCFIEKSWKNTRQSIPILPAQPKIDNLFLKKWWAFFTKLTFEMIII